MMLSPLSCAMIIAPASCPLMIGSDRSIRMMVRSKFGRYADRFATVIGHGCIVAEHPDDGGEAIAAIDAVINNRCPAAVGHR